MVMLQRLQQWQLLPKGTKMGSLRGTRVFWSRTLLHVMKNCSVECDAGYGPTPKHVKNPETDRGHGEEIDGEQLLGMILKECPPGLGRWFAAAHHVFADAALTDVDAEFEQFAVDAGCTTTAGGPPRSILGVLLRTSEARRFGGAEPGSRPPGQHVNERSRTALRGVS